MSGEVCRFCSRPVAVCHEPVDKRFPVAAQAAYEAAALTVAHKCDGGQRDDLVKTQRWAQHGLGWCLDRAVAHREWTGDLPAGVSPRLLSGARR